MVALVDRTTWAILVLISSLYSNKLQLNEDIHINAPFQVVSMYNDAIVNLEG